MRHLPTRAERVAVVSRPLVAEPAGRARTGFWRSMRRVVGGRTRKAQRYGSMAAACRVTRGCTVIPGPPICTWGSG